MKRPISVRVGACTYEVRSDPDTDSALDADESRGWCTADRSIIRVNSRLSPQMWDIVLQHEIMHAAWDQTGLTETLKLLGIEEPTDLEEAIVAALSPILANVEYVHL